VNDDWELVGFLSNAHAYSKREHRRFCLRLNEVGRDWRNSLTGKSTVFSRDMVSFREEVDT